jgi:RNA polymerase sigma-70 factor (ECF subfamily)
MRDELLQHLRQRLFLGTEETGPKLAEYGGRGGLERWVRAVAARLALNLRRDRKDERFAELGEDELIGAPIGAEDPELAHIKGLYRQEFKQAFSEALASLEPELQNFLRLYYLELSQLASLYRFSVPTMSRRLAKAREAALEATRSVLQRRLTVSADELASIMRLIQSRLTMR